MKQKNYTSKKIVALLSIIFLASFSLFDYSIAAANSPAKQPLQKIEFRTGGTNKSDYVKGEILVKYKSSAINLKKSSGRAQADKFESGQGLKKLSEFKNMNVRLLKSNKSTSDMVKELKSDPSVDYAEPDYTRHLDTDPNDAFFGLQWALNNSGQAVNGKTGTAGDDIKAPTAWSAENSSAYSVIVADIDTGVNYNHQDLSANMWDGTNCVDENDVLISGGCPNHGWNYATNYPIGDNDPMDTDGHGTFVAGIIAGDANNATGVSGVSYYNHIKLMPVEFGLDVASEIEAIDFAKNNGAKVINASFGGSSYSQAEKDAIDAFPGIFVASAGNNGTDNDATPVYPASYGSSNIISVASTDQNDNLSSFSDYGAVSVDIAAPGENIISTYYNPTSPSNTSYGYGDGTSFAAPYVSGVAAVLFGQFPNFTTTDLKNQILDTGETVANLSGKVATGKILDFSAAMEQVATPAISLAGGTYFSNQSVTLSTATPGAGIYYTTDGSTPTSSSIPYTGAIAVSSSETIKVIAAKAGMLNSNVVSATYVISIPTPVYRFWSNTYMHHFYTASLDEKNYVIAHYPTNIWNYEGIGFDAFAAQQANTVPVYRFWSNKYNGHFYTASESEKDYVISHYPTNIWNYEGIAFYAYPTQEPNTTPVYRFWSSSYNGHFYTSSETEKDYIIAHYPTSVWNYEGVAWYVPVI